MHINDEVTELDPPKSTEGSKPRNHFFFLPHSEIAALLLSIYAWYFAFSAAANADSVFLRWNEKIYFLLFSIYFLFLY